MGGVVFFLARKGACLLGQGSQDELPLGDAYVRDGEAFVVELEVVVEEDVEVDVAGALVYELLAAKGVLNVLEGVEEMQRLQGGLDLAEGLVTAAREQSERAREHEATDEPRRRR